MTQKNLDNKVGICYDTSFFVNRETLRWDKENFVVGIKWEDWTK